MKNLICYQKNKHLLWILVMAFILSNVFLFLPLNNALALDITDSNFFKIFIGETGYTTAGVTADTPVEKIGLIVKMILSFVGIIFLILTIYAGFIWMTAGGNEEQVKKARELLKNAIIGLLIVLSAYIITTFIFYFLYPGESPSSI